MSTLLDQLLDAAVQHDWVVDAKPPFGGRGGDITESRG
jgi:hypothetical protein